jgi:hypothetical protein
MQSARLMRHSNAERRSKQDRPSRERCFSDSASPASGSPGGGSPPRLSLALRSGFGTRPGEPAASVCGRWSSNWRPISAARILRRLSNALGVAQPCDVATPPTSVGGGSNGNGDGRDSKNSATGCGQRSGGANRRQRARPVANRELAGSASCAPQCLLRFPGTPTHGRTVLAQPAEPPYADPHLRWCGRLCQEDAQASCCTKDEGGPFGATL